MLRETKHKPLLLDYTQWENGQTGSVGMFSSNGSATENYRVLATDPWGKETVVWEARPDSTSGADGGWNASYVPVDSSYYYRFSIWVRKPVIGNGSTYLGCYGSPAVLNLSNGASNGNPYFWAGGLSHQDWVLIVGHIHPEGTAAGSAIHPDSGFYRVGDGRIGNISTDYIFASGTTSARHRSYLYYSTNTETRQQWCYPRMDKCDGTEPTIDELLAGHDSRNEEFIRSSGNSTKKPLNVGDTTTISSMSEVSIANGLVAWYPLQGDAIDYANRNDGVVTGAVPDARGYSFDGVDDYIATGNIEFGTSATVSYWVNLNQISKLQFVFGKNTEAGTNLVLCGVSATNKAQITVLNTNLLGAATISSGVWYHITGTYRFDGTNTIGSIYVNGVLDGTNSVSGSHVDQVSTKTQIGMEWDSTTAKSDFVNGNIADVRIYNRALSVDEVSILYNTTNPESRTKMKMTEDSVYIQGQFKEV